MRKLLFIEDDPIVGRIYACQFEWAGYQVELAEDGETGMRALERFKPDLVVLDVMLPKIGGIEVIKRIRAQPATK